MLRQQLLWMGKAVVMMAFCCAFVTPRAGAQQDPPARAGRIPRLTVVNETPLPLTIERVREDNTRLVLPQPVQPQSTRLFATQPGTSWHFTAGQRQLVIYKATDEPEQKVVIDLKSQGGNLNCAAHFVNITPDRLDVLWANFEGKEQQSGTIEPGATFDAPGTFRGHVWLFRKQATHEIVDAIRLPPDLAKFTAQVGSFGVGGQAQPNSQPASPTAGKLRILRAFYRSPKGGKPIDVTALLARQVHDDFLDIEITDETMGGDPLPTEPKVLDITFVDLTGKIIKRTVPQYTRLTIGKGAPNPDPEPQPNPQPIPQPKPQPAVESLQFYGGRSSLGRGFNMFAASPTEETVAQVKQFHGGLSEQQLYHNAVQIPGNVDLVPQADQFQSDLTASYNASEVQDSLQTALGIEGSYRGVTASVQATYGTEALRQQSTTFVEYRVLVRPAVAQFKAGAAVRLTPDFEAALEQFRNPGSVADIGLQDRFFKAYGTHYVDQVTLGGSCNMIAKLRHSANMDKEDIGVAAKASFDGKVFSVGVSTDVKLSLQKKRFEDNSRVTFTASGGDANIIVTGGGNRGQINKAAYDRWVSSLRNPNALSDIGRRLSPIWGLASDETVKRNLQEAFKSYAQRRQQQLDATQFGKQVIGYTVDVTLDKVDIIDDQDAGIDAGDMFWDITVRHPGEKHTLSHVERGNTVGLASGNTYAFRDIVNDKFSLDKTFNVKPGEWIDFEGYMTDEDGGLNGADDPLGTFHFSFQALNPMDEQEMVAELNGNAKVYFKVKISAVY